MKKRTLTLLISLGALILVAALLILILSLDKDIEKKEKNVEDNTLIDVVPDMNSEVDYIEYTNSYGTFAFELNEGEWQYKDDADFPLSTNYIQAIANDVDSLTAVRDLTEDAKDMKEYGFGKPSVTLKVGYEDGKELLFVFGVYASEGVYMKHDDKIYVVDTALMGDCSRDISGLAKLEAMTPVDTMKIVSVNVDGTEYTDEASIESFVYDYQFISVESYVDHKDIGKYGFGETDHSISVKYVEENMIEDEEGNLVSAEVEKEYSFKFAEKDSSEYLVFNDSETVYMTNNKAKALLDCVKPESEETASE